MAKKICTYGILASLCMIFGYIESLVPLTFIAPGIKLGLSNSIALLLVAKGDIKGAFAVNITRILLSAFLFSTPFSLLFSLTAGIGAILIMWAVSKLQSVGIVGFSVLGAVTHNMIQLLVAFAVLGVSVIYYLPIMILAGALSGGVIGVISNIIFKKLKTSGLF